MNILNWNYGGLNSTRKRHILHDLIVDHSVDLVLVQETKKEEFTQRYLNSISTRLDLWVWKPSVGRSGGILVGADSNKIVIIQSSIHRFCISLIIENRIDNKQWQLIVVYAPVLRSLKSLFWEELNSIRDDTYELAVISGDFNAIRHRNE